MSVKYDEVEILTGGIKYDRPSKGSFALNMFKRYGAWEVRQGFGQITQFDCRLTNNLTGLATEWGYQQHLGSYAIHTNFGHDQIVSVFTARVATSESSYPDFVSGSTKGRRLQDATIYLVSIYDVTTGERWEEPLYRHTSESGLTRDDLELRRGQYETNADEDFQSWVLARSSDTFSFVEVRDNLYFGNPTTDLYAYTPCTFRGNRRRHVSGAHQRQWAPPYSESSLVWRVRPSPGAFPDVYVYRNRAGVPAPQALTSWDGRLVIAGNDRELFFSQKDRPSVFIDADVIIVPTEQQITALAPMGQSIYIFTETETWMYQPASRGGDPLASQGMEPVRVSDSIGCISQACVTKKDGAAVWLSKQGVHLSSGGLEVQTISGDIAPLFTDFLTDPSTTFFSTITGQTGEVNTVFPQRNSVVTLNTKGAHVVYSNALEAVLVTLPEERASLCFSGGEWSLWSYESNTMSSVGAVRKILSPWVVVRDRRIFMVGSRDTQALLDRANYGGDGAAPVDDDTTSQSAYVLEYARGGAIDRSIDDEDHRTVAGKYIEEPSSLMPGYDSFLYLSEWLPVEQQYKFNGTATGAAAPNGESAPSAPGRTVLVPVQLVPGIGFNSAASGIEKVEIVFRFDNQHWRPIYEPGSVSDIDLSFPSERLGSVSGWTTARVEDGAGVPDANGNVIHLLWDGAAATHLFQPTLPVIPEQLNTLCLLPMKTDLNRDVSGMGLQQVPAVPWCRLTDANTVVYTTSVAYWREWRVFSVRKEDSEAQPVDWAYMSEDVALPEDARIKARGLNVRLLSHDEGRDITGSWTQGIFNTMMAADLKTWTAQVVDFIGDVATFIKPVSVKTNLYPVVNTDATTRDRVQNSSGALIKPTFEIGGTVYGDEAVKTFEAGTYLIGDEQVDEVTTSDSVKGNSVATMLFGFMRNPAERLKLESVKLLYRVVTANRRRRGR